MIILRQNQLTLTVHEPDALNGRYRGTRFDHAGDFDSILFGGTDYAQQWFETYNPFAHDAVGGPAEEFSPIFLPEGRLLKIGVGLLNAPGEAEYDRFKLYPIVDAGERQTLQEEGSVCFIHRMAGFYDYRKTIALTGPDSFRISHSLSATGAGTLRGDVYNHNFFTLGRTVTGPGREIDFPFTPDGHWRSVYDSVAVAGKGLRFSRELVKGESVFMGDLHPEGSAEAFPYAFSVSEGGRRVEVSGSVPVHHIVFWANHRIACIEPYNCFSIAPGETYHWHTDYKLI